MMKRVKNTRIVMCTVLLAFGLVTLGLSSPSLAREYVSVGQAGDPGDGDEADMATGSSSTTLVGGSNAAATSRVQPLLTVLLIPILLNGTIVFAVIVAPACANTRQ